MLSVGSEIRKLRKSKRMSIRQLADKSGLSTGLISQVERNKVVPSINAMLKIVDALDVTMGYFFDKEKDLSAIVRKDERYTIATNDESRIYELLTPIHDRKIQFMLITLKGGAKTKGNAISHEGEECGYVIKGSMVVVIEGKRYILHEGDSIYFDSSKPHIYESYNNEESISIWAMTPPSW